MELFAAVRTDDPELALEAAVCEWAIGAKFNAMMGLLAIAG